MSTPERTPQFMGEFDAACGLAAVARGKRRAGRSLRRLALFCVQVLGMPKRRPPLTDEEGEVRELIREDFRGMRPVREAMPELIEAMAEFRHKLGCPRVEAPRSISASGWRRTSSRASGRAAPATTPASSRRCARPGSARRL
jgi:hypothetical protein